MRLRLSTLVLVEGGVCVGFAMLGLLFAELRSQLFFSASMTAALLLMHGAMVPFLGGSFILYDAPVDSPVKYYFFASIAVAAFAAGFIRNTAMALAG